MSLMPRRWTKGIVRVLLIAGTSSPSPQDIVRFEGETRRYGCKAARSRQVGVYDKISLTPGLNETVNNGKSDRNDELATRSWNLFRSTRQTTETQAQGSKVTWEPRGGKGATFGSGTA